MIMLSIVLCKFIYFNIHYIIYSVISERSEVFNTSILYPSCFLEGTLDATAPTTKE